MNAAIAGSLLCAGAFCRQQGRNLMLVSSTSSDSSVVRYATEELHFRCLKDNDAEYGRPTMQRAPDVTVKVDK